MLITNRISYLLVMLGLQLSACSHSAMPTIPRSVGSPGTDCRTQLLADLEDWERSDRLNSTSWCAEGCSGVNIYYADQGEKTGLLIRQLEQGRKVSIEDVDEASDAEAINWGCFSYNGPVLRGCDAAYEKGHPWLPRDQHEPTN